MTIFKMLFVAQIFSTLFMTGLIWFIQIVHYPLYNQIAPDCFANYESIHCRLTTYVVGVPMIVEALSSVLLLAFLPEQIPLDEALVGAISTVLIWIATALFSVPNHSILANGFDEKAYLGLCRLNWIRTTCWTLRTALLLRWLVKLMPSE